MSVAALMMVKDEEDLIGFQLDYLKTQVDEIYVYDNKSTDHTYQKILARMNKPTGASIVLGLDEEPGYYQSRKMTKWAHEIWQYGYNWVIPCDADEVWYSPDGRTLKEYLDGIPPDVQIVKAELYNHLPTAADDFGEKNPFKRIGWRQRERAPLPKVACRLRPDLTIEAGNHAARTQGTALAVPGLVVRHFSWRSEEQYLRKIRNGFAAYEATDLPLATGLHWRMWSPEVEDETIKDHFRQWFYVKDPQADSSLIYDPAPMG